MITLFEFVIEEEGALVAELKDRPGGIEVEAEEVGGADAIEIGGLLCH